MDYTTRIETASDGTYSGYLISHWFVDCGQRFVGMPLVINHKSRLKAVKLLQQKSRRVIRDLWKSDKIGVFRFYRECK
jgi:hypothetical protein